MHRIVKLFIAILMITSSCAAASKAQEKDMDRLIGALIHVESHGNDHALGDRHMVQKAYGPLQIRQPCVDDVNQYKKSKLKAEEMLGNRTLSVWVCRTYLRRYATRKQLGRKPSLEDMARIWNGGPEGYKKQGTLHYWTKVKKALAGVDGQPMPTRR